MICNVVLTLWIPVAKRLFPCTHISFLHKGRFSFKENAYKLQFCFTRYTVEYFDRKSKIAVEKFRFIIFLWGKIYLQAELYFFLKSGKTLFKCFHVCCSTTFHWKKWVVEKHNPSATKATLVRKGRQIPWFVDQVIDMFSKIVNFDTMPSMHSALKQQTNPPKTTWC